MILTDYFLRLGFIFKDGEWHKENMRIYQGFLVDSNSYIECWTFNIDNHIVFRETSEKFYLNIKSYFRKGIIKDLL